MGRPMRDVSDRLWAKVKRGPGCWEWTGNRDKNGYGRIATKRGVPTLVHRLSYMLHFGDASGLVVMHGCDNPPCVRPGHLFLGTPGDNAKDAANKGLLSRGEGHCKSKLTNEQTRLLREDVASGSMTQRTVAKKYGVSASLVTMIKQGKVRRAV